MRKITMMFMLTASTLAATHAFASSSNQNQMDAGYVNNDAFAVMNYWTPERMRDAKPLPLPSIDPKILKEQEVNQGQSISKQGVAPSLHIKPDMTPLFKNKKSEMMMPMNSGTANAHFSSTRLVPLDADISYPYSAIGQLYFTINGDNYVCSASVIGKRVLVTAGHCVHAGSGGANGYYKNFVFVPARHNNTQPFGKWVFNYVKTTTAWMNGNGQVPNAGDFALIELKDNVINGTTTSIGQVTGQLGYATQKLTPNHLNMMGYPCNFDNCALMHQVTAGNDKSVAPNNVQYGSDMRGGSSGGPWIQNFGAPASGQSGTNFNQVVAVTSWGYQSSSPKVQGAANFDSTFTALVNDVCSHKPGNC